MAVVGSVVGPVLGVVVYEKPFSHVRLRRRMQRRMRNFSYCVGGFNKLCTYTKSILYLGIIS